MALIQPSMKKGRDNPLRNSTGHRLLLCCQTVVPWKAISVWGLLSGGRNGRCWLMLEAYIWGWFQTIDVIAGELGVSRRRWLARWAQAPAWFLSVLISQDPLCNHNRSVLASIWYSDKLVIKLFPPGLRLGHIYISYILCFRWTMDKGWSWSRKHGWGKKDR